MERVHIRGGRSVSVSALPCGQPSQVSQSHQQQALCLSVRGSVVFLDSTHTHTHSLQEFEEAHGNLTGEGQQQERTGQGCGGGGGGGGGGS